MSTFKYRPDIDGLRAIAVLSVVIFHINPKWLPSGFLGVDIFFVLSGFLITSIIYREMLVGAFSFKEFYIRRIKRILPLFFVVLITGLLASWYVFLPKDSTRVAYTALSSVFFLANYYFARQGGYFDTSSDEKPFLHLWSLSIEEQFYFVFPVFLLLILRISFLRKNILQILGLGILVSLSSAFIDLNKIGVYWDAYYLSHIRVGEMLVGSFLAVYMTEEKRREEKRAADYLGLILLAILLVCFFLDKVFVSPYFPGVLALVPCLATAGLIYINQEATKISSLLSLKLMVWMGKISYSLYLWHWVVLAIMRYVYQESELPMSWNILAVMMMLVLSILTYYFVENPCRKLQWSFGKNLVCFYIIPALFVMIIFYQIKSRMGEGIGKYVNYTETLCHNELNNNCIKGDVTKQNKVICVGNSFMAHLNPWIDKVGKAEGWSAVVVSSDRFPFAFDWEGDKQSIFYPLKRQRDEFFIKNYKDYPIVVFHYSKDTDEFNKKFVETLIRLRTEGKKVYVITSTVKANGNVVRNYNNKNNGLYYRNVKFNENPEEDILSFIPNDLGINKIDLRQDVPKTFYIDGKPILADTDHWNTYGAEKMAEIFISKGKRFIKEKDLE